MSILLVAISRLPMPSVAMMMGRLDCDNYLVKLNMTRFLDLQAEPILIEDDIPCEVCRSAEDGGCMLLCDGPGCNKGFHMHCLTPALTSIPEGDWLCPGCSPDDIAGTSWPSGVCA